MAYDPLIEAWINADLDGLRTIQVKEGGGWFVFTLAAHAVFADALQDWEDLVNAEGGLSADYTFSFSETAGTVTFARAGGNFDLRLSDSLFTALGHPAEEQLGAGSFVSTATPTLFWNVLVADYDAPRPITEVDLLELRHGRALAQHHHHSRMTKINLLEDTVTARLMLSSPILGGRVRVYTSTDRANAYAPTELDGYHQGYCVGLEDLETLGASDQLAAIEFLLSVEA